MMLPSASLPFGQVDSIRTHKVQSVQRGKRSKGQSRKLAEAFFLSKSSAGIVDDANMLDFSDDEYFIAGEVQ